MVFMNERIRELAEQADPEHWHKRWYSGINPRVMDPEIKKFAELIVRECIDIVLDSSIEYTTRPQVASEIKQHFGVE
jgi:hypothetical protein